MALAVVAFSLLAHLALLGCVHAQQQADDELATPASIRRCWHQTS